MVLSKGGSVLLGAISMARDLGIDLKLLDYLMSIYEGPKSLMEDKSIFNASEIESDSNFKLK